MAVSLVVMAAILVSTVFLPKMHTIAQQSRYRRLKLMTGSSDSTVYTTFRGDSHHHHPHLPPAGAAAAPMYYPAYNAAGVLSGDAGHRQQSRSQSRYSSGGMLTPSRLLQPTVFLPPLSATNGQAMPSAYGFRFNGLNFLAGGVVPPPAYSSANPTGAARSHGGVIGGRYDWSREHSPGGGFYHTNSIAVNNSNWRKISRISDASSSSKKSKSSEQQLIVSSLQRQAKRGTSVAASKSSKKSSLSLQQQQQQQRSLGGSLLLQPSRLDYDENARVYHITP